jgi:hypothetical protein
MGINKNNNKEIEIEILKKCIPLKEVSKNKVRRAR